MMIKIIINSLIGAILVIIWLQFVDLPAILKSLSQVNVSYLGLIAIFIFLSQAIRAVRLKIFLLPIKNIPTKNLIFLNALAAMINFLIPIRAGEVVKGIYLNQTYNLPVAKSLIWIFLDRFIDFLLVLFLIGPLLLIFPTNLPVSFTYLALGIFIINLILVYLLIFQVSFSKKIAKFLSNLLIFNYIKRYFDRFINFLFETFSILKRRPTELSLFFALGILAYGADAAIWYICFAALGVNQDYFKMYFAQVLSALTYLIPAAPGYVGSAEASGLLIFSGILRIEPNLASAMIILFHLLIAIFIPGFGLISLYLLKLDLGLIFKKALRTKSASSA